ncbi:MAG TPA: cytochrome c3 family protein [Kofleriaceae bacterium]|nr:cytochrome c3 family protein [Kofleriaceae bacterium]
MKQTRLLPLLLLAGALPVALADPAAPDPTTVSEVVFPEQALPLRFSHALHLGRLKMACADCHTAARTSRSSLDLLIPGEDRCTPCHPIDRRDPDKATPAGAAAARCTTCHPGFTPGAPVARVSIPRPNLKFDHRAHRERGIACAACHGDMTRVDLATRDQLPRMALCLDCHDGRRASDRCVTCHLADAGGRIQTAYPQGPLAPAGTLRGDAHDLTFRTDHRAAAEGGQAYCESCHKKDECLDCHDGVMKPLDFHAADYVALHAIEARRGSPDCTACHRLQTFCVGCHSRAGVTSDGKGSQFVAPSEGPPGRRFHPPGWVEFEGDALVTGDDSRGENHHAFQAQRNIQQCASCHRESFCLRCHSAQPSSRRINPHPNGWRGSRRCESLRRKNGRMCLRCHTEDLAVPSCD